MGPKYARDLLEEKFNEEFKGETDTPLSKEYRDACEKYPVTMLTETIQYAMKLRGEDREVSPSKGTRKPLSTAVQSTQGGVEPLLPPG